MITKKKPMWLYECNMFILNGCNIYCTEYIEGISYHNCKHRKVLCVIVSNDLNDMLGD